MRVAGLFSGIGGFELGFENAGFEAVALNEIDETCRAVLRKRFPGVALSQDILALERLPRVDVLTAGFPCQPFSQAGPTIGLPGSRVLLDKIFWLLSSARPRPRYVILENVKNIIHLEHGAAVAHITRSFDQLGYTWAYRVLDTSSFGLPQRRNRWFFIASLDESAPSIILDKRFEGMRKTKRRHGAHGFYWTEGNTGLGWANDAVPPLKAGSGLGIPSPPAIWFRGARTIVTPHIRDAERLQGFPAGWTSASRHRNQQRVRWKMVGNAVSVPVANWLANQILEPGQGFDARGDRFSENKRWPNAAWGRKGERYISDAQTVHVYDDHPPIASFLRNKPEPLSFRATNGFRLRLQSSRLNYLPEFLDDLIHHERYVARLEREQSR